MSVFISKNINCFACFKQSPPTVLTMFVITFFALIIPEVVLAKQKTIMHINSFHQGFWWTDKAVEAVDEVLGKDNKVFHFYMNNKTRPEEEYEQITNEMLAKITEIKPDMILLGEDDALKLIGPKIKDMEVPKIFWGIDGNPRNYFSDGIPYYLTGVLERYPTFASRVRYVQFIAQASGKDFKTVFISGDQSETYKAIFGEEFKRYEISDGNVILSGVKLNFQTFEYWNEFKEEILKENFDFLISGTYGSLKNKPKKIQQHQDIINWIANNSTKPNFDGLVRYFDNMVGGCHVNYEEMYRMASLKAKRILSDDGENKMKSMKDRVIAESFELESPLECIYNVRMLEKYDLVLPDAWLLGDGDIKLAERVDGKLKFLNLENERKKMNARRQAVIEKNKKAAEVKERANKLRDGNLS